MEWTDAAAAEAARLGDQQAFRVLVERHSHALFRLAYRMTGNEQDAEDLVQETFLRAFKQLKNFDGRAAFGTWLHRICVNRSLDTLRARKTRKEVSQPLTDDSVNWLDRVAAPQPSPERWTHSGEITGLLEPALQQLSESERIAFVLRHYEDQPIEEIARTLGVRTNAAKHSVFRAVQKLRRMLEPAWGGAPK
jgi:RNA polymerase sigma-70 factor (ECF subfamily)